jgi:hypothetical protein
MAGKRIKCPRCSEAVTVAAAQPAAAMAGARASAPPAPAAAASGSAPSGNLSVPCAACRKKLQVRADMAGKAVKCPGCGKPVRVPGAAPTAAAPAAPRPERPRPAPAAPPAAQDDEWIEVNEAAEAPVAAAAPALARAGGPGAEWGQDLMEGHGVPDDMQEKIRSNLTKNERLIWFGRPRMDILMHQARMWMIRGSLVGGAVCIGMAVGSVFAFRAKDVPVAVGIILVFFSLVFGAIAVFALGAPARQKRKESTRACYAMTNRRLLLHLGTGSQTFSSGSHSTTVVNTGALGLLTYSGLELTRLQRVEMKKFPGAGNLVFSRTVLDEPSGGGLWAVNDVAGVEKLIREKLLHPVIDKVLRGEKLSKEEKGKDAKDDKAAGEGASGDTVAPDDNIKSIAAKGDLVPDDPNIKAAPGTRGRGGDGNVKGVALGIEYDPNKVEAEVREEVEAELTAGEKVLWVGQPEGGTQGRGVLGAVTGAAKRKEPNYYLYAITNRRAILWAKPEGGFLSVKGDPPGPTTYYPPHILRAGLEQDNRIPQGGSIVFKQVKVTVRRQDKQSRRITEEVTLHFFGILRVRRYKTVALLLYENLIKPWVEN